MTRVTPPPAACGAQKTQRLDATRTRPRQVPANANGGHHGASRTAAAAAASRLGSKRSRMSHCLRAYISFTAASMEKARAPTTTPTTTHRTLLPRVAPVYP